MFSSFFDFFGIFWCFSFFYFSIFHVFFVHSLLIFFDFFLKINFLGRVLCFFFFSFVCRTAPPLDHPKFRFSTLPPQMSFFLLALGGLLVECHGSPTVRVKLVSGWERQLLLPSSPPLPSPSPPLLPLLPLNRCRRQHEKLQEHRCFGCLQVRSATPRSVHSWS